MSESFDIRNILASQATELATLLPPLAEALQRGRLDHYGPQGLRDLMASLGTIQQSLLLLLAEAQAPPAGPAAQ